MNDCEENMEAIRDIYSEFNGMQEADQNVARQMMDRMKEIIKQNGNPVRGSDHYSVNGKLSEDGNVFECCQARRKRQRNFI